MRLNQEVLRKIRHIEIQTRRLLRGTLIGDYSSAQKGSGLEFDQLREYQVGDDVRFIDWNASARSDKILVKQYIEERNRTVMILVDCSASMLYGSSEHLKSQICAQIASVFALVADYGKDTVGAILFADTVKAVVPPKRGRQHVHAIMETLFLAVPSGTTSLQSALERLMSLQKKDAIIVIVSDFFGQGYEKTLKVVARHHEVIAVKCTDPREQQLPECGYLPVVDPETGHTGVVATGSGINNLLRTHHETVNATIRACGVDILDLPIDRPFVGEIIRFFRRRMMY